MSYGTKLLPEERRDIILRAGVRIVRELGWEHVSLDRTSKYCAFPTSMKTVQYYYQNRELLCMCIVGYAQRMRFPDILADAERYGWLPVTGTNGPA